MRAIWADGFCFPLKVELVLPALCEVGWGQVARRLKRVLMTTMMMV